MDTVGTEASPVITELKESFQVDEGRVKSFLEEKMRGTIEEMMNKMLDAEADALCQAERYQRSPERVNTRSGSYQRQLHTTVGDVTLKMPRLRSYQFETQIIERYRRIPTVIDRLIQQALNQALTPHYDPTFSASSFGYRPKRSAHQALDRAKEHIGAGHRWVVDVDLEKFFDRVNHDVLMSRLAWLGGTGILLVPCHLRQPASHGSVSDASDSQLALRFAASKSTKSFALDTLPRLGQTLDALGPRDASLSQCAL